ncbi:MAG TPA: alpha-hydroxy acid oxidase [Paenirhodobacter sp.]
MTDALNFHDLRAQAKRRLPRGLFEYIDRGSEDETGLKHTRAAFNAYRMAPRALVPGEPSLKTRIFGEEQDLPLIAAPTAMTGLVWHQGETALARATEAAGFPYCAATSAITSVEDIAAASVKRLWFQLYLWDRGDLWRALIDRAWVAGARTLVLTIDTNVLPKREFNSRNGFGMPLRPGLRNVLDVLSHPGWARNVLLRYLRNGGWPELANYPDGFRPNILRGAGREKLNHEANLSWDHVRQLREAWQGNLVIKGVLRADDALRAADHGADGIVVSSHGARNLDSSVAPIEVLRQISQAAGDRLTILADSGVQRGSDIFKLLAEGAQAVLIGRAFLYGTASGGQAGAADAIRILREELQTTMRLAGVTSISDIRSHAD